jgi:hypothetical protein
LLPSNVFLLRRRWASCPDIEKADAISTDVVCGVDENAPEFYKVPSRALLSKQPRVVICYEYDKNLIKDIVEQITCGGWAVRADVYQRALPTLALNTFGWL